MTAIYGNINLGYAVVASRQLARWREFGAEGLGLHAETGGAGELLFRMDDHARRLIVTHGDAEDMVAIGWEARNDDVCQEVIRRVRKLGVKVREGTDEEARLRGVEGFFQFLGPKRLLVEVYTRPVRTQAALEMASSGWITGDIGMGHLAITSKKPGLMADFWKSCFDARHTDLIEARISGINLEIEFLRVNPRHHSIAIAATRGMKVDPIRTRIQHMNLEVSSLDDVTNAYTRCRKLGFRVAMGVGLHTNDRDLSFYVISPSGFQIECGWNPVQIRDDAQWQPAVYQGISLWGHQPTDQNLGDKLGEARNALASVFRPEYAISAEWKGSAT